MQWLQYEQLSDCAGGERVRLVAVTHSGDDFLRFLNSRGLQLGLELLVKSVEAYDGSITISYGKKGAETLSRMVSEKLLVEKI
jgi:DtxR family Mn-dependent transcriptional regulator